jgi:hypothetical protein
MGVGASVEQRAVGRAMNNGVHLCHPEALTTTTHVLVGNNDQSVYALSLPTGNVVAELQLPAAVNSGAPWPPSVHASGGSDSPPRTAVAMSPDGRRVVTVGDTRVVGLFDVRGEQYARMRLFEGTWAGRARARTRPTQAHEPCVRGEGC